MSDFQIYSSPGSRQHRSPNPRDQSPQYSNADFYRRKAERLEEDLLNLTEELSKARMRLTRAEDFQIKHEMLFKQKCSLEEELQKRDQELLMITARNEEMSLLLKEKGVKNDESKYQREYLYKELELLKEKVGEAEERARVGIAEEKNKASETIDRELRAIRKNFGEAEEEYQFKIARLTKLLEEKEATNTTSFSRYDKQSKEKESQIARLEGIIKGNREDYLQMVGQKNKEIEGIKLKFEKLLNDGLGSIQKNMSHQDSKFKTELEGLKNIIAIKNEEIDNLHQELNTALEEHSKERRELNDEIQLLKAKIYERDRQNQEELFNMKERLASLHAIDIEATKKHYEELVEGLRDERKELEALMDDKDRKVEYERQEFEKGRQQLKLIIENRDRTIEDLKQRLTATGHSSTNQLGALQQTLNKYADEKETMSNEYKSNISFLNQQITKLTTSNQLKNNEIRELHQYTAFLKKEHFENIKDLEGKWKQERKEREGEREKERDLREKVEEEFREKENLWKNRERELEMELEKEKRQKNRWAATNQKLEKELERLYKEIADLEDNFKKEFSKSQNMVISGGGSKRDLMNELERQKSDLQAMKRMEIDQVKKKYQLEVTRLTNLTQKLQTELTSKKIEFQKLEDEFRKVSSQYRNIEKINKDKITDYHKKMASLNSEILLTQNLYQSLIAAKGKVKKEPDLAK